MGQVDFSIGVLVGRYLPMGRDTMVRKAVQRAIMDFFGFSVSDMIDKYE